MRALLLASALLAACAPSEPTAPPAAEAAAPARPSYPPAEAGWSVVPLAEGAIPTAVAATEIPPSFRNGAGAVACPVMGMAIAKPEDAVSYADHDGVRYFFCCDSCEKLFLDEPGTYAWGKYLADHRLDPTAAPTCGQAEEATCGAGEATKG